MKTTKKTSRLSAVGIVARSQTLLLLAALVIAAIGGVVSKNYLARSQTTALVAVVDEQGITGQLHPTTKSKLLASNPPATPARLPAVEVAPVATQPVVQPVPEPVAEVASKVDLSIRWFNGRPVRPAKTMTMVVTAYSPDEISCPGTADNITASLHHVQTNAFRSVAADTRLLPLGSMISVPGYDDGQIVPVLDRGGAIKCRRLDVLYPTHERARQWGVQRLTVTVWEYADGLPAGDWRAERDGRN